MNSWEVAEIVSLFDAAFQKIAQSHGDRSSRQWMNAEAVFYFPEVEELCLGYTGLGTRGSGSGNSIRRQVANALWNAVAAGLTHIEHFEEIQIFETNIGADRISDATANIIRHRLAAYTRRVCEKHKVPMRQFHYRSGRFSATEMRWRPLRAELPVNPYNRRGVLLVPHLYLRNLPSINAAGFWDYCFDNHNQQLRMEFGSDISRKVDKQTIVDFARRHSSVRAAYVRSIEDGPVSPYDFKSDPQGHVHWYPVAKEWCAENPIQSNISNPEKLKEFIERILEEFRNFVENNKGWQQLWNDNGKPRKEEIAQNLFLGVVKHYCSAQNVDISREPNIGRGPVDFKVSLGHKCRALIELKLSKNTKFWNGLTKQLPKYLEAEQIDIGYFLVICYGDKDFERISSIELEIKKLNSSLPYDIGVEVVDASSNPPSASTL